VIRHVEVEVEVDVEEVEVSTHQIGEVLHTCGSARSVAGDMSVAVACIT
jgi:hypothetical protein